MIIGMYICIYIYAVFVFWKASPVHAIHSVQLEEYCWKPSFGVKLPTLALRDLFMPFLNFVLYYSLIIVVSNLIVFSVSVFSKYRNVNL
jgi:hypothetical protein